MVEINYQNPLQSLCMNAAETFNENKEQIMDSSFSHFII